MKYLDNSFVLHIIGEGDKDKYQKLITLHNLDEKIKIIQPYYKYKDPYYKNSDLFVLCSRFEGFGIVVLNAISYKLPCICTKSGGVEDIIENNKNGFLIENFEPRHIAQKIKEVNKLSIKEKKRIINES